MSWYRCGLYLVAGLCFLLLPVQLIGQDFEKSILLDELDQPVGITVDFRGNLYFTQVPNPGEAGAENSVTRYDLRRKTSQLIASGEPYPTNLAADLKSNVYWTCQTAGVILRADRRGDVELFREGLNTPVGLDSSLFGTLFFTEVPTPGVNGDEGGSNKVIRSGRFFDRVLSEGEPEPSDVAVALNGDIYWTCKTAGVILKRDRRGEISLVQDGLASPVGLHIDFFGRLYWTEVPTPGVSGDEGGTNRVVRYNPRNGNLLVISQGEPEPVDVTSDLFGRNVYWTCKTAGVIIRATRKRRGR